MTHDFTWNMIRAFAVVAMSCFHSTAVGKCLFSAEKTLAGCVLQFVRTFEIQVTDFTAYFTRSPVVVSKYS